MNQPVTNKSISFISRDEWNTAIIGTMQIIHPRLLSFQGLKKSLNSFIRSTERKYSPVFGFG